MSNEMHSSDSLLANVRRLINDRNSQSAVQLLDEMDPEVTRRFDAQYLRLVALFRLGYFQGVYSLADKIVQEAPEQSRADVLYYQALALERLGKTDEAIGLYSKIADKYPDHALARSKLREVPELHVERVQESRVTPANPPLAIRQEIIQAPPGRVFSNRALADKLDERAVVSGDSAGTLIYTSRQLLRSKSIGMALIGVISFIWPPLLLVLLPVLFCVVINTKSKSIDIFQHRIDLHTGWLISRSDSVWLYDVVNVQFEQSLLQRIFDTASLKVERADGRVVELYSFGSAEQIRTLWGEIRDSSTMERRHMKRIWI